MLASSAAGFGSLALRSLVADEADQISRKSELGIPHYVSKAKRVIFLFMHGGPSHVDTFDYKPLLKKDHGKPLPFAKPRVQFAQTGNLLASPWEFAQHGQSGHWVSELFPELAKQSDKLCLIRSIHGSNEAHGGALLKMHTGSDTFVRPSMGAWISYGLGTENQNLPAFITIQPTLGHGGVQNFGAAFLPAEHQGVRIGHRGANIKNVGIPNLTPSYSNLSDQALDLAYLEKINQLDLTEKGPDDHLEARIESFELAFRMQMEAPPLFDVSRETDATKNLYGIDQENTDSFGRQCLLAARMSEAGVRFVQCTHGYWDQHSQLEKNHSKLANEVDLPIAGLLQDLQGRGLLDETLVIWGGEFGRTPTAQGKDGRDHNPHAFTWWLAGGGSRPGFSYGITDDYGYYSVDQKVHVHDLHATLLRLLGIDHEKLTYHYGGRDFRLTDVAGDIIEPVISV